MNKEITPKSAPSMLIDKDWTQRRCMARNGKQEFQDRVHDLEVRDDDVFVVTLPKCGTTWMQEMAWLILNNFDFEQAKQKPQELRSPFIEYPLLLGLENEPDVFKALKEAQPPRLIKTHLPLPLLPQQLWLKKPKVIYVFRNPKDALVSAYYFRQNFGYGLDKTLEEYITEELDYELEVNARWNHVLEFYQLRNEPWVYYTSFENLKKDLRKEITQVCKFLNRTITEEQMQKMLHHLSFEEMKNNPQCNHTYEFEMFKKIKNQKFAENKFMRSGKVGGYKDELSPELIDKLDKWIEDSLRPLQLTLDDLLL